jgi:dTDP-glucose 4,6-dehydratase
MKNIDVVRIVCKILNKLRPIKFSNVKRYEQLIRYVEDRPGHDMRYAIDISKIKKELKWFPKETFESGIKKTIEWYLNNKKWYQKISKKSYKGERLGKAR